VTEKLNLLSEENTLAQLAIQLLLSESLQHHAQMSLVFLHGATVHEDIIQEDEHELVELLPESVLHERHELGRCVGQAHGEDQPLEVTVARRERRLSDVLRRHSDLPVARAQVELTEVARPLQLVK